MWVVCDPHSHASYEPSEFSLACQWLCWSNRAQSPSRHVSSTRTGRRVQQMSPPSLLPELSLLTVSPCMLLMTTMFDWLLWVFRKQNHAIDCNICSCSTAQGLKCIWTFCGLHILDLHSAIRRCTDDVMSVLCKCFLLNKGGMALNFLQCSSRF